MRIIGKRNNMICMICSKEFVPISHKPRCCSKECSNINRKAIKKEWYERNKEKLVLDSNEYYHKNKKRIRIASSDYRKLNRDEILARKREYRNRNKDIIKEKSKKYAKESGHVIKNTWLKNNYGISLDTYNEMSKAQNGRCYICNNIETALIKKTGKVKDLAVDHCHTTGKVRGLLCNLCNISLGGFKDSVDLLQSAINYLKKHGENNG